MKNKITVIGSGAMATAIAKVAYDAGNENIVIYGVKQTELDELTKGFNTRYFPNSVTLPKFKTSNDITEALEEASYVILAVPSKVMDIVLANVISNLSSEVILVNVAKGFFPGTELSLHEGIYEAIKNNELIRGSVSVIGPSHAEEIVRKQPTAVAIVDKDKKIIAEIQKILNNDYFRTYVQTDVKGAEVGAAYKNVLAIVSGMVSGMGYGINSTAALLTRGIKEMAKFNKAMKGKPETIMGLTGVGDLIVTALSPLSRNFAFGKKLATEGLKALKTDTTVEGITSLDIIYKIANSKKIELPIVNFLYEILYKNRDINTIIKTFWDRELTAE